MSKTKSQNDFIPPRWILTLIVVSVVAWLVVECQEIVILLVVGFSIAYIIEPIVAYMEKKKIRRSIAWFFFTRFSYIDNLLVSSFGCASFI